MESAAYQNAAWGWAVSGESLADSAVSGDGPETGRGPCAWAPSRAGDAASVLGDVAEAWREKGYDIIVLLASPLSFQYSEYSAFSRIALPQHGSGQNGQSYLRQLCERGRAVHNPGRQCKGSTDRTRLTVPSLMPLVS